MISKLDRRAAMRTGFVMIGGAAIAASVLFAPALMPDPSRRFSQADLEYAGYVYNAVTSLISALALVGVATSLMLQRRQTRIAQVVSARERHFELVRLALEDKLLRHFPGWLGGVDEHEAAIIAYANLWVAHWSMYWDLHRMSEANLRFAARRLFESNRIVIDWWTREGSIWRLDPSPRDRRFLQVLSEECACASQQFREAKIID